MSLSNYRIDIDCLITSVATPKFDGADKNPAYFSVRVIVESSFVSTSCAASAEIFDT